jgi:hypothetical protein
MGFYQNQIIPLLIDLTMPGIDSPKTLGPFNVWSYSSGHSIEEDD